MFWCNFGRGIVLHVIRSSRQSSNAATGAKVKKLFIRNVLKDNPSVKYYLLTAVTVTVGTTYYVYNNQNKKKFTLDVLPATPNHYTASPGVNEIDELLSLLKKGSLHEVDINGPPGSGKTQLARKVAELLNKRRKQSFQFRIWPKDEVTGTLIAHSKEALSMSLKQFASNLGCERDEVKFEGHDDLEHQLDVFSDAVKEKLKQKPSWILVVDNHDEGISLSKWLPTTEWGRGYVIHTVNSQNFSVSEGESCRASFTVKRMTSEFAKNLFCGIMDETSDISESQKEPPEHLLSLLQHNPFSVTCAAIYFKQKVQQNKDYGYNNLYEDIMQSVKQLQEIDPDLSNLQVIQTISATLATKAIGEQSPELFHVFDFLGSCCVNNPIPLSIFSHHLKTSEYHVQMETEEIPEQDVPNEDTNLSINTTFEQEHSLWSFRGIVDRAVTFYERIKLEVHAIKGLLGYGDAALATQLKAKPDGLEIIRSCPLFLISHEPMAGIEVVAVHPIIHSIFRQIFINVTIPLLEQQHLVLAERKHQRKSYFGRLRSFDPQSAIAEYRNGLGDISSLKASEGEGNNDKGSGFEKAQSFVGSILHTHNDNLSQIQGQYTSVHLQEHFGRVVNTISNHYRIAGGDSSVLVSRAMLVPHLEGLLKERSLTAASKAQVYRILANIHSEVSGDYAAGMQLLNKAYAAIKDRYGEDCLQIAEILTEQAELCSTTEELDKSKVLLERAVDIYQKSIKTSQTDKQPFQYGKALVALGVTCGGLGETSRSKDLLERGLMELQAAAPGDPHAKENKWFAAEISSAVTSLGHAYLSLGKISQGRKLLELALIGHQNVHGDTHSEVIRTLTTLSIAYAMQGNSQESKRLRNQAGKIKKKLDMRAPLFLH